MEIQKNEKQQADKVSEMKYRIREVIGSCLKEELKISLIDDFCDIFGHEIKSEYRPEGGPDGEAVTAHYLGPFSHSEVGELLTSEAWDHYCYMPPPPNAEPMWTDCSDLAWVAALAMQKAIEDGDQEELEFLWPEP